MFVNIDTNIYIPNFNDLQFLILIIHDRNLFGKIAVKWNNYEIED